jgi:hypothetical protein
MVEPDKIRHPVRVRVTGDDNVVGDVVGREDVEGLVTVALVSILGIVVEWIDAAEDRLATDHTPCGIAGLGLFQGVIEPVFLPAAHHRPASVIGNCVDVVGVPVQVRDGAIVLPGIKHGQVHQLAELEVSPDSEVVIHLDLTVQHLATCGQRRSGAIIPERHPFKVGSDGVHLPLVGGNATISDE